MADNTEQNKKHNGLKWITARNTRISVNEIDSLGVKRGSTPVTDECLFAYREQLGR